MDFNGYSDHAPLHVVLHSDRIAGQRVNDEDEHIYIRWNDELKTEFRRGLISQLPKLNEISLNINTMDKTNVNNCVERFIEIINVVAMPSFTKIRHKTGKPNHASFGPIKRAAWFDKECYEKKRVYMEAVKRLYALKSDENRQLLFEAKRAYKLLTMNKKRSHTITKMRNIEGLKKKEPKDFWKYFSKRKAKRGNNIQDFQEYFQTLSDGLNGFSNPEAEQFSERPSDPNDPIYEELDNDITPAERRS
ncbi:hypothetical protein MAR_030907 [Mya arenaria]|uniref:Reverse transcriptase n=1 Tax=Mya arenaria TaxID=6604 RepID=A0ABY7F6J4_MYAAR|nr:hypothetical protein MAR_030907 [Mya arenaria]